jgi:hypothetical protein
MKAALALLKNLQHLKIVQEIFGLGFESLLGMCLAGPALETVAIQTVNIINDIGELDHDFKFFESLIRVGSAQIFNNLKYLFI